LQRGRSSKYQNSAPDRFLKRRRRKKKVSETSRKQNSIVSAQPTG
jgi:hypothetical protein